jgi:tetratricopeptide (TPR) repeat protein
VGKSRLRFEWVRALENKPESPQIWIGRGDPLRAGSPFAMLAPAIRRIAGVIEGEPVAVQRRKLRARVARDLGETDGARIAEFIGEMVGVPFDADESVPLAAARRDAMVMADQTTRAFVELVASECASRPLVIVLEDLHWGDAPSVKLLDAALRALPESPLMIVALARPEVLDRFPQLWSERGVQSLALVELTPKRSTKLVRAVLGDDVPETTVAHIVERAQGNAFYLEELIRAVAEGRSAHDDLPETVLAMVQGRIERLEPDARRVLRAASVFGEVFWARGVGALVSDLPMRDDWLDTLVAREVIKRRGVGRFPDEEEFSFRHALVREAAYAMLTDDDRVLGHRLAGDWLEAAGEGSSMVLAEHFERGRDVERAAQFYVRAANQALAANDFEGAIARSHKAVECGAKGAELGALRSLQAEAHRWRGEFAEARRCGVEALDHLPRDGDEWHRAAAEVALSAGRLGDVEALLLILARLRARPLDLDASPSRVIAWTRTAGQMILAGPRETAEEVFAQIERVAGAVTDPTVAGRIALVRAMRSLFSGDPVGYRTHTSEAASAFERAGDLRSAAMQRVSVGYASVGLGDDAYAERVLRETLESAEKMGLGNVVAYCRNNLGLALARRGALDEARRVETDALHAFKKQGDGRLAHSSHVYLALIRLQSGDVAGAERDARAAVEFFHKASGLRAFALATLAQVLLASGRAAEALERAREAKSILDAAGSIEEGDALVRLTLAEAMSAAGRDVDARDSISDARERLLARAEKILDPSLRRSFLERVPENARTIARAAEWVDSLPPPARRA